MLTTLATADEAAAWLAARLAAGAGRLRTDSRSVQAGDAFLAWAGRSTDGRRHVPAALAAGAAACLVDADGIDSVVELAALPAADADRVAMLPGLKAVVSAVAAVHAGHPSARLQVVAATGTNGKTSTAWWLAQALTLLGRRCGVVGTLGIGEPGHVEPTGLTTPDAVALQAAFKDFADRGFVACAVEASSIGIAEQRLAAVQVAVALFTNFTRDHLDFHGDMATYWAAKRQLFAWPGLRAAVVNVDDLQGAALAGELAAELAAARAADLAADPQRVALDLWTVALHGPARLQGVNLRYADGGLVFDATEDGTTATVQTQLVGDFNASNLLVVLGGLRALGVPLAAAAAVCTALQPVPGRLQRVPAATAADGVEVVVDYAHTPDALDKVLQALRPLAAARGGKLWCVFGCGGNRDATKRPLMGAIAAKGADAVVVTSDNPRDEKPAAILAQILAGITGMPGHDDVTVIEDRHDAIAHAVRHAATADVVLLAGKGHEDTQEIGGIRRPFSDVVEASAALRLRHGVAA